MNTGSFALIHSQFNPNNYKLRKQNITNPTVGNSITQACPVGYRSAIALLKFRLDTDANGANRAISVTNYTGGNFTTLGATTFVQVASKIYNYISHSSATAMPALSTDYLYIPLPRWAIMVTGDIMYITVQNIQVGDQLRDIWIHWAMWPSPA